MFPFYFNQERRRRDFGIVLRITAVNTSAGERLPNRINICGRENRGRVRTCIPVRHVTGSVFRIGMGHSLEAIKCGATNSEKCTRQWNDASSHINSDLNESVSKCYEQILRFLE